MKYFLAAAICFCSLFSLIGEGLTYPVVDTGVTDFYDNDSLMDKPDEGEPFFGQDAHFRGNQPSYTNGGGGTVIDNVTGLVWQKTMGEKMTLDEALLAADSLTLGGYSDWRVPTIKELYSLILFTGRVMGQKADTFFIDRDYFDHPLGNTAAGEREIDAQTWSSTEYVGRTMGRDKTIFGVNFVDGRIKGYPVNHPRTKAPNRMYFRFVRGNPDYGENRFKDNYDGTVTDMATGLQWQKEDSGRAMDWEASLAFGANLELAGHDDWRLPSAKELQSLVDYTRSMQTSLSAAIDPLFSVTTIYDAGGDLNFPYYWTGTTHQDGPDPYSSAAYVAFGEAQGMVDNRLMDVHGAGAQRSDPKTGDPDDFPQYQGPQGDVRYVFNFVRCVRTADTAEEK